MIDRVPNMLTYISLLYAVVFAIAFFLVTLPPKSDEELEIERNNREKGVWDGLKEFLKVFA